MIMSKTISVSQIKEAAQEAYEQFKDNTGGKNADYIPYCLLYTSDAADE